jgi:dipeptidyl aminopeptidase/acylaminoacyl peptidase
VDEKLGWVYFTAHGDQQRPYDTHLYRVNLDGKKFTRLTEGTGQHRIIQFAPSREFFLDTHSSIERPPAVDLRRADGTLLQTLSRANIDALKEELKWNPPEEFVVKAADGKTDLYGNLYKPYDFDPNKKYPVIEVNYARGTVVSHNFIRDSRGVQAQALAQLGFVTFVVDGRGTPKRGKEFQDVVYGNLGRHEIPDHVATLRQLAEERPYMDLSRVGIYGYSAGGYFTTRAMLLAPDVYHVGIAGAPPVDAYGWAHLNERLMGLPEKNKQGYEYASNLRLAGNLKGKLLIIHPTSDVNIPFSQTMKMVEALIRAGKPYDLLVFPEQNHSPAQWSETTRRYMQDAIRRYFQEYLKP